MIFNNNGLKEKYGKAGNFIWERALLSIGDFLIWEGRNQSFLINFDRDISWKRLLRGDKNNTHPGIIKAMFDALDCKHIEESLEKLIENFEGEDWRKAFIETSELFNYLGPKRYVRRDSPQGYVLLKGERMSGAHVELFTYHLYLESFRDKQFSTFKIVRYEEIIGAEDYWPPHIKITNWENTPYLIQIRHYNSGFLIRFNIPQTGNSKIINILEENGMKFTGHDTLGYEIVKESANVTVKIVENICTELQNITL
jgi:hypothetical protein